MFRVSIFIMIFCVQVAARISPDNADKDEWIVVKVIRFDRESNKCDILNAIALEFVYTYFRID